MIFFFFQLKQLVYFLSFGRAIKCGEFWRYAATKVCLLSFQTEADGTSFVVFWMPKREEKKDVWKK